jgi:hypothetical protein
LDSRKKEVFANIIMNYLKTKTKHIHPISAELQNYKNSKILL